MGGMFFVIQKKIAVLFQPAGCNKEYQMFGTSFSVRVLVGSYNTLIANLCKVCTCQFLFYEKDLSNTVQLKHTNKF
jgi:hypothetical protein